MSPSTGLQIRRRGVHDRAMDAIESAARRQAQRVTADTDDMAGYLAQQVGDRSHREVTGPVRPGKGASGVTPRGEPRSAFAYNDVRVNLLALALTVLWRRPLPDVLATELMGPLGGSDTWCWHGYADSLVAVDGRELPVVSGGAHWGGGLWASANDLARLGSLYVRRGRWNGRQLLNAEWIEASWRPGAINPDYGYLWWLNDRQRIFPTAPATGRCARGNGGRHLLWVDPARHLVIASHWSEDVEMLLCEVSAAVPAA
jgi:CubicO group peptidase (beta-lactamase class C family)